MKKYISIFIKISQYIESLINNMDYQHRSWKKEGFYPRPTRCKLSFREIICLLLKASKRSLQVEINQFLLDNDIQCDSYSKQAFSKRRQLIKPEAIAELFQCAAKIFYQEADYETYRDNVVIAIDGCRINLPDSQEIKDCFGQQKTGGVPQNQALTSCAFDVLNGMYLDTTISYCKDNERKLAQQHIDYINDTYNFKNIIYLFDRGYPSAELFKNLINSGAKFVFRCDETFIRSMNIDGNDCTLQHKFKKLDESLTFRIVTLKNTDDTDYEILATNLSETEYSTEDLKYLYNLRWGIETSYDHAKNAICLENFSGTTVTAIKQDYYASMYLYNMAQVVIFDNKNDFNKKHNQNNSNKYTYKQNLSVVIGTLKPILIKMLLATSNAERIRYNNYINACLISATTEIKNDRHFKREVKHKSSKFSNSRRPIC